MIGKSVFVVGGASGIGLAAARHFIACGAATTIVDVSAEKVEVAKRTLAVPGARVQGYAADIREPASLQLAFAQGAAGHGGVDALVFTAGVLLPATLSEMTDADYDMTFDVNTKGFWRCFQAAEPYFPDIGGAIVAVSSAAGQRPKAGNGAYAASKAALQFLVRTLALEVAHRQLRVNCVAPSMLDTPMTKKILASPSEGKFTLTSATPLGRMCIPADVVQAIAFLCSDQASFITGTTLAVDGGSTAGVPLAS
ncbi:SDR family NAD(P)-dependent oxidoreductase [Bordetella sp. LUAb4]|uniref:SDR family NAD(P)-dependent oxidoreductase n=1 Tax=Bordetella sp. LUAb4 TaxID=2843195 RepID=UPI001E3DE392|nr:SDR family NAD(P)-dependent oxidoreductase [Bordetella sp. LUAb4]